MCYVLFMQCIFCLIIGAKIFGHPLPVFLSLIPPGTPCQFATGYLRKLGDVATMRKRRSWCTAFDHKYTVHVDHLAPVVRSDISYSAHLVHIVSPKLNYCSIFNPPPERYCVHAAYLLHQRECCWVTNRHVDLIKSIIYLKKN